MPQSPKSKRPKAALEKPSSDGLSESKSGGSSPGRHGPAGSGKPTVPSMPRPDTRSSGQGGGGEAKGPRTVPVGSAAGSGGGSPGGSSLQGTDAMRKGGTTSRFAENRGKNS